jgi:hypothetical protein
MDTNSLENAVALIGAMRGLHPVAQGINWHQATTLITSGVTALGVIGHFIITHGGLKGITMKLIYGDTPPDQKPTPPPVEAPKS